MVAFDPSEREAERPEECTVVWVDESSGSVVGSVAEAEPAAAPDGDELSYNH